MVSVLRKSPAFDPWRAMTRAPLRFSAVKIRVLIFVATLAIASLAGADRLGARLSNGVRTADGSEIQRRFGSLALRALRFGGRLDSVSDEAVRSRSHLSIAPRSMRHNFPARMPGMRPARSRREMVVR